MWTQWKYRLSQWDRNLWKIFQFIWVLPYFTVENFNFDLDFVFSNQILAARSITFHFFLDYICEQKNQFGVTFVPLNWELFTFFRYFSYEFPSIFAWDFFCSFLFFFVKCIYTWTFLCTLVSKSWICVWVSFSAKNEKISSDDDDDDDAAFKLFFQDS